jgi:hypothetical protein
MEFFKTSQVIWYHAKEYLKTFSDNSPKFMQTGKNLLAVPFLYS